MLAHKLWSDEELYRAILSHRVRESGIGGGALLDRKLIAGRFLMPPRTCPTGVAICLLGRVLPRNLDLSTKFTTRKVLRVDVDVGSTSANCLKKTG